MTCADTSFLISLYGDDVNSAAAREHQQSSRQPIHMHALVRFELTNALRALVFRGKITKSQLLEWLAEMETDQEAGLLVEIKINANEALHEAETLSDSRQRQLAQAEGLDVGP